MMTHSGAIQALLWPTVAYSMAILVAGGSLGVDAQSTDKTLTFEVASIRQAPPPPYATPPKMTGGPGSTDPGRFTAERLTLLHYIMHAYNLKTRIELSAPAWMDTPRFNITAKVPVGITRDQFRIMLQNLLAERFSLKVHRENREAPIYKLVVAKNGHKLKESQEEETDTSGQVTLPGNWRGTDKDGFPLLPPGHSSLMIMDANKAIKRGHRESTEDLATLLSAQLGRAVEDATGLHGRYDYTLRWSTTHLTASLVAFDSAGRAAMNPGDDRGTPLSDALQEQLGLRLVATKGLTTVLVVDHAEKIPTDN